MKQNSQTVTIETPEHIELQFVLAGIGERFLAYLVDRLIQFGLLALLIVMVGLVLYALGSIDQVVDIFARMRRHIGQWVIALVIIVYGLITTGYFIIFEFFWGGSTPGKRSQHIRVIRRDGRPISFVDTALRNILRFLDIVGDVYPLGLLFMFLDSRHRRLGDMAAGTLVVQEDRESVAPVSEAPSDSSHIDPDLRMAASRMTPQDYHLVSRFLSRRKGLEPMSRRAVAGAISDAISRRAEQQFDSTLQPEHILEDLEALYRDNMRIL